MKRAVCECDQQLATKIKEIEINLDSIGYNVDNCISYMHKEKFKYKIKNQTYTSSLSPND